jgi:hypothetical protein
MGEDHQELLLFAVFVVKSKRRRVEFRVAVFRSVSEPSSRVGRLCGVGSVVDRLSSFEFVDISSLVDGVGWCVRRGHAEFGK